MLLFVDYEMFHIFLQVLILIQFDKPIRMNNISYRVDEMGNIVVQGVDSRKRVFTYNVWLPLAKEKGRETSNEKDPRVMFEGEEKRLMPWWHLHTWVFMQGKLSSAHYTIRDCCANTQQFSQSK